MDGARTGQKLEAGGKVTGSAPLMRIVAYERVFTAKQGASGLGLEAQRQAIRKNVAAKGAILTGRFTEVESGRNANRPELAKAPHLAKVTCSILVVAKLDLLSRNAAFLSTLRGFGVRFLAGDMAEANAAAHATDLAPVVADIRATGHVSLRAIAPVNGAGRSFALCPCHCSLRQ